MVPVGSSPPSAVLVSAPYPLTPVARLVGRPIVDPTAPRRTSTWTEPVLTTLAESAVVPAGRVAVSPTGRTSDRVSATRPPGVAAIGAGARGTVGPVAGLPAPPAVPAAAPPAP